MHLNRSLFFSAPYSFCCAMLIFMSLRDMKALARTPPKTHETIKPSEGRLAFLSVVLPLRREDFSSDDDFDEQYYLNFPVGLGVNGVELSDKVKD